MKYVVSKFLVVCIRVRACVEGKKDVVEAVGPLYETLTARFQKR